MIDKRKKCKKCGKYIIQVLTRMGDGKITKRTHCENCYYVINKT